jgi:hypothetical protein
MANPQETFATPELAALAQWAESPGAHARLIAVRHAEDEAEVEIEVDPGYRYWVWCERREDGWVEVQSSNLPSLGSLDPRVWE